MHTLQISSHPETIDDMCVPAVSLRVPWLLWKQDLDAKNLDRFVCYIGDWTRILQVHISAFI